MKNSINGQYNSIKLEQAWAQQREEYTQCVYYRMCHFARPVSLCQDTPDLCPVKIHTDEKTKNKLDGLVEEFPK